MTAAKLRLAQVAMGEPGTNVGELCAELGVTRQTLYRPTWTHEAHTGQMGRSFSGGRAKGKAGSQTGTRSSMTPRK